MFDLHNEVKMQIEKEIRLKQYMYRKMNREAYSSQHTSKSKKTQKSKSKKQLGLIQQNTMSINNRQDGDESTSSAKFRHIELSNINNNDYLNIHNIQEVESSRSRKSHLLEHTEQTPINHSKDNFGLNNTIAYSSTLHKKQL